MTNLTKEKRPGILDSKAAGIYEARMMGPQPHIIRHGGGLGSPQLDYLQGIEREEVSLAPYSCRVHSGESWLFNSGHHFRVTIRAVDAQSCFAPVSQLAPREARSLHLGGSRNRPADRHKPEPSPIIAYGVKHDRE